MFLKEKASAGNGSKWQSFKFQRNVKKNIFSPEMFLIENVRETGVWNQNILTAISERLVGFLFSFVIYRPCIRDRRLLETLPC